MQNKYLEIYEKYKKIYNLRIFRKRFIPIEKIAQNPKKYGYLNLEKRDSKAQQENFIKSTTKVNALICANRSGKTEAGAIKFLNICLASKISGRAWVVSESFDLQKAGVQEKILDYLKPEDIIYDDKVKGKILKEIHIKNKYGKTIIVEFKTFEQGSKKLQTAKLICAWIDEEPPEEIYDEVYTRTVDLRGQIILTFTPLKGFTWSYKRIFNSKSLFIKVFCWGMWDNPFIHQSEINELLATLTKKQANMRVYGKYQGAEMMIFDCFDREKHLKPNLYDLNLNVKVSIDWGVVVTSIQFWQKHTIVEKEKTYYIYKLINARELENVGYSHVMNYILKQEYIIDEWFCDPAGRARNQATRSGKSLLFLIQKEYGIKFQYIVHLGVEESIDLVNSNFENATGDVRIYIDSGIILNDREETPAERLENYVRDEKTLEPVKDGINDHFCDCMRYGISNMSRRFNSWRQT